MALEENIEQSKRLLLVSFLELEELIKTQKMLETCIHLLLSHLSLYLTKSAVELVLAEIPNKNKRLSSE